MFDDLIYNNRNHKIDFVYEKDINILYIDLSKLNIFQRIFKKKHICLQKQDIEKLRILLSFYDNSQNISNTVNQS